MDSRMNQHQENNIEALSEQLGLLRITEEDILKETTDIETTDKILTAPVLVVYNEQAVMPKSMVPDLGWFNMNRIKFEDQQGEIQFISQKQQSNNNR